MSFTITSAKLTGNPDKEGWAQAYQFSPSDSEKLALRGGVFATISTSALDVGLDAVVAGREVISRLHEEYFGRLDTPAFKALKSSIEKIILELSSWEKIEIGCMTYLADVIYIAVGGGAEVFLLRNDVLTSLIQSEEGKVTAASGYPRSSDLFIIGTSAFFKHFSPGVLKGSFSGKDPARAVESLAPTLHALPSAGGVGALLLSFGEQSETYVPIDKIESEPQKEAQKKIEVSDKKSKITQKPYEQPTEKKGRVFDFLKRVRERNIYIHDVNKFENLNPKRKISLGLGLALLTLLLISIIFGIRQERQRKERLVYEEVVESVSHNLSEAEELQALNPQRSRELLLEARQKVLGLATAVADSKLLELKEKIKENEAKILGEYKSEPEVFVELGLLSEGFVGDEIVFSQERIFVADKNSRKIARISIESKRSEVVVGPHVIDKIDGIAAYLERVFIINAEGVFEIEDGKKEKKIEPEWMGSVLVYAYGGNFYILDKGASTIYRYTGFEDGFGSKKDWFNEGIAYDVSEARTWVIDGSIWVLEGDGEILKFSLGNKVPFSLKRVFPEIVTPLSIFTDDQLENLYILDNENERVVVVSKDGEYKAQYTSSDVRRAKGLVASEKEKKIFLLTSDKLLAIQMEHM